MVNPCCNKPRFDYNTMGHNKPRNVRYNYIDLAPLTKGLKVDVTAINTGHELVWYSYDNVTLTIQRKGCTDSCGDSLVYTASVITDNTICFIFDQEFYKLCRGRYEGIIAIDCDELPCRLDFKIGQQICITRTVVEKQVDDQGMSIVDASDIPNPNCCDRCEEPKPCGCFDATQQSVLCGNSISCEPEQINLQFETAMCQLEELDNWIQEQTANAQSPNTENLSFDVTAESSELDNLQLTVESEVQVR